MQIDPKHWPSLSRLLDEALEMSPEARERWLESLPPGDSDYKEELRTLLRHESVAEAGDFLDILPNLKDAVDNARAAVNVTPLSPGTAVGPYVVEREIGCGGMGAVWLARRSDGLIKRPVALKLPHAGPHGLHLAERFASERDILAELSHPNIARLYDAGFAEDGQPFLALEYVAGAPLIEYCDQQRLDVRQRLRLFQQVLRAVQYAHGNLVIHRDLKPSNVIVGQDGRAMLLDFGIARLIAIEPRDENGRGPAPPAGGGLTPDYASPEQIAAQPVTTASDIYSLGVLLFELLTGERPHRAAGMSRAQFEEGVLTRTAPRPSRVLQQSSMAQGAASARSCTVRGLAAALVGDLDAIALKTLATAPADRYATADALSADIECHLDGEPIAAGKNNRWYRTRKFIVRHRPSVVGAAAALLAIIATAGIALYEAHAAAGHARAAAAQRDRALALSSRNEAIADFLNVLITEAAASDAPLTTSDMLARSEALVSAEFRGNIEHRTAVLDMVGAYYRTMGDEKRSLRLLQEAFDAIATSPDADLRRKVTCDLALTMANLGRVPEARGLLQRVVDDSQATVQQVAECLTYRSEVALIEGDSQGAVRYGRDALQRLRTVANPSAATEAGILGAIADGELARTGAPANGPFQVALLITRGRIALANNQLAAARMHLDAALMEGNTMFFQMAALVPHAELNLKEGRLADAEADARKALALAQDAQGDVSSSCRTGLAWLALGKVLTQKGDGVAARQALLAANRPPGQHTRPGSPPVVAGATAAPGLNVMVSGIGNSTEDGLMNTRMTAELHLALGSAFSATLLGVAVRDLEHLPALGDRLLEELHKRGFAVYRQPDAPVLEHGA